MYQKYLKRLSGGVKFFSPRKIAFRDVWTAPALSSCPFPAASAAAGIVRPKRLLQRRNGQVTPAIQTGQPSLRFPRHARDQWLHVPHPLLVQPPQLLPRDPTNRPSPLNANVENCFVTFRLSHLGQATRLRLEATRFSKL
jgi:hypothetical protein